MIQHDASPEFLDYMLAACQQHLEDEEVRVRLAVGMCLRTLAELRGAAVYEACSARILDSIEAHFVSTLLLSSQGLPARRITVSCRCDQQPVTVD